MSNPNLQTLLTRYVDNAGPIPCDVGQRHVRREQWLLKLVAIAYQQGVTDSRTPKGGLQRAQEASLLVNG